MNQPRKIDEMGIFELIDEIQRLAAEMNADHLPPKSPPRDFHDTADACPRCGAKQRGAGCRCSDH